MPIYVGTTKVTSLYDYNSTSIKTVIVDNNAPFYTPLPSTIWVAEGVSFSEMYDNGITSYTFEYTNIFRNMAGYYSQIEFVIRYQTTYILQSKTIIATSTGTTTVTTSGSNTATITISQSGPRTYFTLTFSGDFALEPRITGIYGTVRI
jgi:hypothetical protein